MAKSGPSVMSLASKDGPAFGIQASGRAAQSQGCDRREAWSAQAVKAAGGIENYWVKDAVYTLDAQEGTDNRDGKAQAAADERIPVIAATVDVSSIDVPIQSQILGASEAVPFLSMRLRLDVSAVQEILNREDLPEPRSLVRAAQFGCR